MGKVDTVDGQLATRPQTATIYSMITNGAKRYESLSVASC
jgi:hypothetical protein